MTDLVRPTPGSGDIQYGEWIGRIALALIFLFNGFGIVDQSRAAQELTAHGTPTALVPLLIIAGRVLQIAAGIALVVGWHERLRHSTSLLFSSPRRSPRTISGPTMGPNGRGSWSTS